MKIRNGFVSNSSSSSFCIVGICFCNIDKAISTLEPLFDKLNIAREAGCRCDIDRQKLQLNDFGFCPKCGKPLLKKYTLGDIAGKLRPKCSEIDISIELDENAIYIGKCIGSDSGDRVLDEINKMKNTDRQLKELFGKNADIRVYTLETC